MGNFDQFAATLRGALDQAGAEDVLFSKIEARRQEEDAASGGGRAVPRHWTSREQ